MPSQVAEAKMKSELAANSSNVLITQVREAVTREEALVEAEKEETATLPPSLYCHCAINVPSLCQHCAITVPSLC